MIKELDKMSSRYLYLVNELNSNYWSDPVQRLANIATQDGSLKQHLEWQAKDDGQDEKDDLHSLKSDYSLISSFTLASNISRTNSVKSNSSRSSSVMSGTTVSMMSKLSTMDTQISTDKKVEKSSGFAIEGIEHSVLSRGTNKTSNAKESSDKHKKKMVRRDGKIGRDGFNLKKEGELADELASLADISNVALMICNMMDTLLLINTPKELTLLTALMQSMSKYIQTVQANLPVLAPNYPVEWLEKRSLMSIRLFQDKEAMKLIAPVNNNAAVGTKGTPQLTALEITESWWEHVIKGVVVWCNKSKRYNTLIPK